MCGVVTDDASLPRAKARDYGFILGWTELIRVENRLKPVTTRKIRSRGL